MPLFSFEGKSSARASVRVHRADRGHHRRRDDRGARLGLVQRRASAPTSSRSSCAAAPTCRTARSCTSTARRAWRSGAGATVGHNCTVHAASLGEECLIGNGATVLDGARIGIARDGGRRRPGDPRHRDPRRHARAWAPPPRSAAPSPAPPPSAGSKPTPRATRCSPSATSPIAPRIASRRPRLTNSISIDAYDTLQRIAAMSIDPEVTHQVIGTRC